MHALSGLILGFQQDLDACTHTSHLVSSSTRSHTTAPTRARSAARPSHHWQPQAPPSRYQRRAWRAARPAALDSAAILGRAPATWASHAESRAAASQGGEKRRPSLRGSPAHCARERDRVHDEIRSGASPSLPDMSAEDDGDPCLPLLSLFVRVSLPLLFHFGGTTWCTQRRTRSGRPAPIASAWSSGSLASTSRYVMRVHAPDRTCCAILLARWPSMISWVCERAADMAGVLQVDR